MSGVFTLPAIEVCLVGLLSACVGVHVVLRRRAFFTMAMSHATFPGVVIASMLGLNLYLGGALFGLLAVAGIAALDRRRGQDSATSTGIVLSAGFAVGVLLVSVQPGFTKELSGYLVGSVLTVQASDLVITVVLGVVVLAVLAGTGRVLLFAAFDPAGAAAAGYRTGLLDALFLVLVELTVVTNVPAVGTILSLALIVGPAATARMWTRSVLGMTALAAAIGVGCGLGGLLLSRYVQLPAGAAITLLATAALVASLTVSGLRRAAARSPVAVAAER